jgi:methionyl-tRNA formyltransferase
LKKEKYCKPQQTIATFFESETTNKTPGSILCADSKNGLKVACKDGIISIDILQFPGKKAMDAKTYFVGNKIKADFLGK